MMKSKYVLILAAIAAVLMIGLVAAVSVNSTAKADSSNQQCISAKSTCPFAQPASEEISDGCCSKSKKKCDPNSNDGGCKKKCDPNCTK
jgi:hypothetical protein